MRAAKQEWLEMSATAKKSPKSAKFLQAVRARNFKHGFACRDNMLPEFLIWNGINKRCHNPNASKYPDYGGRGIFVCPEWRHDFAAFFAYIGARPSPRHQVDRIDNNRGYEPGNVRWATPLENARNTRRNVLITIGGVTRCASEWDEVAGFPHGSKVVLNRYRRGWRGEELLAARGTIIHGRKQSEAERRKRSETFKRLHSEGVFAASGAKISATKRKRFAEGTAYNQRDERGCFMRKPNAAA
jgi:hypothetical protein